MPAKSPEAVARKKQRKRERERNAVKIGQSITYLCLAGIPSKAIVRAIRPDGSVDIACDVGCRKLHELSRIEVVAGALRPGTCSEGMDISGPGPESASAGPASPANGLLGLKII